MTDTALHFPFKSASFAQTLLKRWAARREARRHDRALREAARRLASISPHLLKDIGLADVPQGRR